MKLTLDAAVTIIDLLLAFDVLMQNRSEIASEFAPGRDRVIELYQISKSRDLTATEEAEIKTIRDSVKDARDAAVKAY